MTPKSKSWSAVEKFMVTSRHEKFDFLVDRISAKYRFTSASLSKLKSVYDEANEEKNV